MKTPLFFIAALAAFFALPFDFTAMASALFAAGLASIMIGDYRAGQRSFRALPITIAASKHALRLAA